MPPAPTKATTSWRPTLDPGTNGMRRWRRVYVAATRAGYGRSRCRRVRLRVRGRSTRHDGRPLSRSRGARDDEPGTAAYPTRAPAEVEALEEIEGDPLHLGLDQRVAIVA